MKLSHPELLILVPHPGRWVDRLVLVMLFDFFPPLQFPPAFIDFLGRKHSEILCGVCFLLEPQRFHVCFIYVFFWFTGLMRFCGTAQTKAAPLDSFDLDVAAGRRPCCPPRPPSTSTTTPSLPIIPSFLFSHMSPGSCDGGMHSVSNPSWCYCQRPHTHVHTLTQTLQFTPEGAVNLRRLSCQWVGWELGFHVFIDMWVSVKAFERRISAACFPLRHCNTYTGRTKNLYFKSNCLEKWCSSIKLNNSGLQHHKFSVNCVHCLWQQNWVCRVSAGWLRLSVFQEPKWLLFASELHDLIQNKSKI